MNESPKQADASDSRDAQNSVLAERLLRRIDGQVGAIDVRRPQQLHSRTAGWVARRFGLLDHWRARYGDAYQALNAGGDMVFTAPIRPSLEIGKAFEGARGGGIIPSGAVATATIAAPLLRVSRRPPTTVATVATAPMLARLADSPGAPAEAETSRRVEAEAPVGTTPTARAGADLSLDAKAEISVGQAAASRPNLIWRRRAEGKAADDGAGSGLTDFTASPLPLKIEPAGVPTLARRVDHGSAADSGKTAGAEPLPVSGAALAQRIDTTRLTEQVSRLLSRQLAVERERRGIE
jgi:hypothetical protein